MNIKTDLIKEVLSKNIKKTLFSSLGLIVSEIWRSEFIKILKYKMEDFPDIKA